MRSSKKVDLSVVSGFWGGAYAPDAPPLATGLPYILHFFTSVFISAPSPTHILSSLIYAMWFLFVENQSFTICENFFLLGGGRYGHFSFKKTSINGFFSVRSGDVRVE